MTVAVANVANTNTVLYWMTRFNETASAMSVKAVTVDSNAATGNAVVNGTLQSITTYTNAISGGVIGTPAVLSFTSNVNMLARTNLGPGSNVIITAGNLTHRVLTVNASNSYTLVGTKLTFADLSDANVSSPSNGQLLVYSTTQAAWINSSQAAEPGSNTYIRFNDSGTAGADANLTWIKTSSTLALAANGKFNVGVSTVNATSLSVANSLSNTLVTSLSAAVQNSTTSSTMSPGAVFVGNATVNLTSNSTSTKIVNATFNSIMTGNYFSAQDTAAANYSVLAYDSAKVINSTSNSTISASSILVQNSTGSSNLTIGTLFLGNSTVNSVTNSTSLKLSNSTTSLTITAANTVQVANGSFYLNANGSWSAAPSPVGKHTVTFPAGALRARNSNGAVISSVEMTANKLNTVTFDFDAANTEYVQASFPAPKSWDESTLTFQIGWSHSNTTTNFGVQWGVQGLALSDGEALDTAYGTEVTVSDTGGVNNALYVTSATAAMTVGNSPAEGDTVFLQIYRDAANTNDTMTVDAKLHWVKMFLNTNAGTDD